MKKIISRINRHGFFAVVAVIFVCMFATACASNNASFGINIHMPGGNETVTRFADEEIMSKSGTIKITAANGAPDAGISLCKSGSTESDAAQYIFSGETVEFKVEKGTWYKIRIQSSGLASGLEYDYGLTIENVELRVSSKSY